MEMTKDYLLRKFHKNLQCLAARSNISQIEMARTVGVSKAAMNEYFSDNSKKAPNVFTAALLAKTLGVSLDYLIGLESYFPDFRFIREWKTEGSLGEDKISIICSLADSGILDAVIRYKTQLEEYLKKINDIRWQLPEYKDWAVDKYDYGFISNEEISEVNRLKKEYEAIKRERIFAEICLREDIDAFKKIIYKGFSDEKDIRDLVYEKSKELEKDIQDLIDLI